MGGLIGGLGGWGRWRGGELGGGWLGGRGLGVGTGFLVEDWMGDG